MPVSRTELTAMCSTPSCAAQVSLRSERSLSCSPMYTPPRLLRRASVARRTARLGLAERGPVGRAADRDASVREVAAAPGLVDLRRAHPAGEAGAVLVDGVVVDELVADVAGQDDVVVAVVRLLLAAGQTAVPDLRYDRTAGVDRLPHLVERPAVEALRRAAVQPARLEPVPLCDDLYRQDQG